MITILKLQTCHGFINMYLHGAGIKRNKSVPHYVKVWDTAANREQRLLIKPQILLLGWPLHSTSTVIQSDVQWELVIVGFRMKMHSLFLPFVICIWIESSSNYTKQLTSAAIRHRQRILSKFLYHKSAYIPFIQYIYYLHIIQRFDFL